jgi:hypothetical protein
MIDLLERYPDAENQLEILKKDFLGLDKPEQGDYINSIDNEEEDD